MQSPKKTPRTRIVKEKQEIQEVKLASTESIPEAAEVQTPKPPKSQKERKEHFQPYVIPTYSPKELNDQYVKTVQKTKKEKLEAKKVKQEWKREQQKLNATR